MTDFRQEVEDDRGLIKKIQLCIPGFRGYRKKEDLRIADSMLRIQIADMLKNNLLQPLEQCREAAGRELELDLMNDLAAVISKAKLSEAKIRHAEQGYTGISAATRVGCDELNQLYEYDLSLIDGITAMGSLASSALLSAEGGDFETVKANLRELKGVFTDFMNIFARRNAEMAGFSVV